MYNVIWEIFNKYLLDIICNYMGGLKWFVMCMFCDIVFVFEMQIFIDIYYYYIFFGEVRYINIIIFIVGQFEYVFFIN